MVGFNRGSSFSGMAFVMGASFLVGASEANAATLTLNASADTTIAQAGDPDYFDANNYGQRTTLGVANYFEQSTLVRFDTTGLAAALSGGTVTSVALNFTVAANVTTAGTPLTLVQLTGANAGWVEGTGGGPGSYAASGPTRYFLNKDANSDDGTSATKGTGTVWAGGGFLSNFYAGANQYQGNAATVYNPTTVTGTFATGDTLSVTIPNAVVTNWIADPTLAAAGLYLTINGAGTGLSFASTEAASGAPTITVIYDAAAVPEPTSLMALAMLAGAGALGRKRRSAF